VGSAAPTTDSAAPISIATVARNAPAAAVAAIPQAFRFLACADLLTDVQSTMTLSIQLAHSSAQLILLLPILLSILLSPHTPLLAVTTAVLLAPRLMGAFGLAAFAMLLPPLARGMAVRTRQANVMVGVLATPPHTPVLAVTMIALRALRRMAACGLGQIVTMQPPRVLAMVAQTLQLSATTPIFLSPAVTPLRTIRPLLTPLPTILPLESPTTILGDDQG